MCAEHPRALERGAGSVNPAGRWASDPFGGLWGAPIRERPTPGFGSGRELRAVGSSPALGSTLGVAPALDSLSPSPTPTPEKKFLWGMYTLRLRQKT